MILSAIKKGRKKSSFYINYCECGLSRFLNLSRISHEAISFSFFSPSGYHLRIYFCIFNIITRKIPTLATSLTGIEVLFYFK